jgi:antitoxin component of MazEF toxin-antitoxin module
MVLSEEAMKARVVHIGNSQDVAIPKLALEQAALTEGGDDDQKIIMGPTEPRRPGSLRGRIHIASDFEAPLPPETAAAFRGENS